MNAQRIFDDHEAAEMFGVIERVLGYPPSAAAGFLRELQGERVLLLAHRSALASLVAAVNTENFNRTGRREMSANLRAALRRANEVLQ